VLFRQVLHPDLGCASYLIADTAAGVGAVVDPKWDIEEYLELAAEHGFQIAHVVETHNHADHLSGRARLVAATGADSWVHRLAEAGYPHHPLEDGDEIVVGQVRLRALHAPGHRPEHTAIVVIDGARSNEPCAVLTGDSLFVNDVARPDLAVEKRDGARDLFTSMQRLVELGDGVEVFPGHTGGSLCGSARMSETTSSTIGFERRTNPLLQLHDQSQFVEELIEALPPQPPNFRRIAALNQAGSEPAPAQPEQLSPERVAELQAGGALVVDGRAPADYDAGHIPGSVGITASGTGFGTRTAWVADSDTGLVLVGYGEDDARGMCELLAAVGITAVTGVLTGGFDAWRTAGRPVESFAVVDVAGLAELRERRPGLQILDVREDHEWDEQRIPGSAHLPYHDLATAPPPIDLDRPVAVICSTGRRSALAVGLVRRAGAGEVLHVTPGGVETWAERGHPIERSAPAPV
jgi:hydroxyacylglutathione hydrolase